MPFGHVSEYNFVKGCVILVTVYAISIISKQHASAW